MTLHLVALTIDANDPSRLAAFWAALLGWDRVERGDGIPTLEPNDDTGFLLRFPATDEPNSGPHQVHFDLTSTSLDDQQGTVDLALALGANHHDVGQLPEEGHVVLADPEGNEFCVIEPGNAFLAGCPSIGALSSDGTRALGHFWSAALGWPLVWDQGEETAVRSPEGGSIISWGGPPLEVRTGRNRFRLELAPSPDSDQGIEVDRLLALGATRIDPGEGDPDAGDADEVRLADPDGNEFCVRGRATMDGPTRGTP